MKKQKTPAGLKKQIAELDPSVDEEAAWRDLCGDLLTPEQFQTVWNAMAVEGFGAICERIKKLGPDAREKFTPVAAFTEAYSDQVTRHEFRNLFLDHRQSLPNPKEENTK